MEAITLGKTGRPFESLIFLFSNLFKNFDIEFYKLIIKLKYEFYVKIGKKIKN